MKLFLCGNYPEGKKDLNGLIGFNGVYLKQFFSSTYFLIMLWLNLDFLIENLKKQ